MGGNLTKVLRCEQHRSPAVACLLKQPGLRSLRDAASPLGRRTLSRPEKQPRTGDGHRESGTPSCLVDCVAFPPVPASHSVGIIASLNHKDRYKFDLIPRNAYLAKNMPASLYFGPRLELKYTNCPHLCIRHELFGTFCHRKLLVFHSRELELDQKCVFCKKPTLTTFHCCFEERLVTWIWRKQATGKARLTGQPRCTLQVRCLPSDLRLALPRPRHLQCVAFGLVCGQTGRLF